VYAYWSTLWPLARIVDIVQSSATVERATVSRVPRIERLGAIAAWVIDGQAAEFANFEVDHLAYDRTDP